MQGLTSESRALSERIIIRGNHCNVLFFVGHCVEIPKRPACAGLSSQSRAHSQV